MPTAKTTGTQIDSPFTPMRSVPKLDEAPGVYNRHPSIGPAGESGGIPLKFFDTSIDAGRSIAGPSQDVKPSKP